MTRRPNRGVEEWPKGSGSWRIDYYDSEGRRHREKIGSRKLAIAVYHQRKLEIWEGRFTPRDRGPKLLFDAMVKQALAHRKPRLSIETHKTNEKNLSLFVGLWAKMPAAQLTPGRITAALNEMAKDGLSGSSLNRRRASLASTFATAIEMGLIDANPVVRVKPYKENSHRIRFLGRDEEKRLRAVIREWFPEREPEFDLALHTGMRGGEQFSLTWENVDLDRGILTVTGKTGRRFIPVNSAARAALEKLHAVSSSDYVCRGQSSRGGKRSYHVWLKVCLAEAKVLNFRRHDLRHTFASRLVMAGVDIRTVQELIGHKSIVMTIRYAHLSPGHQLASVEKLVTALDTPQQDTMP